jgi:uncharacterized phage protein (TIGR01671 family)|nr:MAG TPA: YopX protein [Caudoviricetes sp.]
MTREILFRGKRVNNGEWVEGSYWYSRRSNTYQHFVFDDEGVWVGVDPNTVGRFTGLTDRNGVKIFEGDIVHVKARSCSFTGCVIYWSEEARYACKTKSGIRYAICARLEFEVVGNIYDNPELFGEGET